MKGRSEKLNVLSYLQFADTSRSTFALREASSADKPLAAAQKKYPNLSSCINFGEFICYINLVSLKSAGTVPQDRSCLFLRQ